MDNAQLQQLWTSAGGDAPSADTMAAIALAESHGNPADVNSNASEGHTGSWGLWQINGDAHPQYDHASLLNPAYNASAAVAVKASQGLTAWSTYTHDTNGNPVTPGSASAAYAQHLSTSASGSGSSPAALSAGSPAAQFIAVIQTTDNPLTLLNAWLTNPNVNVVYKTFALCAMLIVLAAIPQTSRFAGWAALGVLFLVMIASDKKAAQSA
jgi:hypothetical protein